MKKICYVVTIATTIKSFFISQLMYLSENGFDVTVVCSEDHELQKLLGYNVHYNPISIPRGVSFIGMVKSLKELTAFFKKEKFDIVQYSTPNAGLVASIAAKKAKIKIRNYHLMGFRYLGAKGIGKTILKWFEKITCKISTSIECVSKSNLKLGIKEGIFPNGKAIVVWNGSTGGVDLVRFDYSKRNVWRKQIREELKISADDFVYGFVGRITKDKGINEILEAFFQLNNKSKLILIGSTESENTLNKELLAKAKDNKNIIFHNAVSDIERYYAAIDVLLLPSYREGFGNVVIEAAACGTTAIVSNIPGPIDAIEKDKTAFVCEAKDTNSLASKMRIITNDYINMGERAYQFCKINFDSVTLNLKILERKIGLFKNG